MLHTGKRMIQKIAFEIVVLWQHMKKIKSLKKVKDGVRITGENGLHQMHRFGAIFT